jgi:DNA adenine methylase
MGYTMLIQHQQPQQLLKWIGNKQRFAKYIIGTMPDEMNTYIEPFFGTGAVLGYLRPKKAIAGDTLKPLIELWEMVKQEPDKVSKFYEKKYYSYMKDPKLIYEQTKESYNSNHNALDLLFLSRTCYGGVMRFTREGIISTPIGPHKPIPPVSFTKRVFEWSRIVANTQFYNQSFERTMCEAKAGDVVYCDPPYLYAQSILYGSQSFKVGELWDSIQKCKDNGAKVLLSIDGNKKSGKVSFTMDMPEGLFERELYVDCGISMLRRLQKSGEIMIGEDVSDRLLLTW